VKTVLVAGFVLLAGAAHAQIYTSHGGYGNDPGDTMMRDPGTGMTQNLSQEDADDRRDRARDQAYSHSPSALDWHPPSAFSSDR